MNTRWRDVEGVSNLADGASIFAERLHKGRVDFQTRSSQLPTFRLRMGQASFHSFPDQSPFKLRKGPKKMKHELAGGGGTVDLFVQSDEGHSQTL